MTSADVKTLAKNRQVKVPYLRGRPQLASFEENPPGGKPLPTTIPNYGYPLGNYHSRTPTRSRQVKLVHRGDYTPSPGLR